jgi:hypothetical protein
MHRRGFLIAAVLLQLSACSWSAPPAKATRWDIFPGPKLVQGKPDIVFDLRPTLPGHVRRGGRFSVSSTGAPLPNGVMLSPEGVLSVTSDATPGFTPGVVFAYDEPAS